MLNVAISNPMSTLSYLKNFFSDRNIASITPTSTFGIECMCSNMDFQQPLVVVEYGPATGVITKEVLQRMTPESRILALDTNKNFLEELRVNIPDQRLAIFHQSAEKVKDALVKSNIKDSKSVNYIISGIPFTFLPESVAERIVHDTYDVLVPGGKFIVYQFLKPDTKKAKGIHQHLPKAFRTIHREIVFRNIPPLRIYIGLKE